LVDASSHSSAPYPRLPGERGWIKTKNRAYLRYELEREGAFKSRRERQFV
jgi:hypothetical protein